MEHQPHHCPACARAFSSILDYPVIRILAVERLPIPEAMDSLSAPAVEKRLTRQRYQVLDSRTWSEDGINMTPAIARAISTPEVAAYLALLSTLIGREVNPKQLLPPWKPSGYFPWAYPVADTGIFLSLSEAESSTDGGRAAEVQVHGEGPNLGSAGGATLQHLGAIAHLLYQGLLTEAFRHLGGA